MPPRGIGSKPFYFKHLRDFAALDGPTQISSNFGQDAKLKAK
jgi:hypothetical protein